MQPIKEIATIAKKYRNIAFHTDAAQSIGKLDVRIPVLGVDLLNIAGHKFCAPKVMEKILREFSRNFSSVGGWRTLCKRGNKTRKIYARGGSRKRFTRRVKKFFFFLLLEFFFFPGIFFTFTNFFFFQDGKYD